MTATELTAARFHFLTFPIIGVHTAPSLGGVPQRRNVHQEEKVEIMDLNIQDEYLPDHRSGKMCKHETRREHVKAYP